MHRGLGIPGPHRQTSSDGTIKAPATDEMFMREYIQEWKRLMKAAPNLQHPAGAVSMTDAHRQARSSRTTRTTSPMRSIEELIADFAIWQRDDAPIIEDHG